MYIVNNIFEINVVDVNAIYFTQITYHLQNLLLEN
jgi:hypothetical protein